MIGLSGYKKRSFGSRQREGWFLGLLLAIVMLLARADSAGGALASATDSLFIVQAESAATAARDVRSVGGHVIRHLTLIDGVAARLSPAQETVLARRADTRLFADRSLSAGSAPVTMAARDHFEVDSFSNSDGTIAWGSDWQEIGESDGPLSGNVRVAGGILSLRDMQYGVQRSVNLSGASSATLKLHARRKAFDDAADYFAIAISTDDGDNWVEVARLAGPANDDGLAPYEIDLSAYVGAAVQLRITSSDTIDKREALTLDNLILEAVYTDNPPPSPIGNLAYNGLIEADALHAQGIRGAGVTVAVVDTGFWQHPALYRNAESQPRVVAQYDAINDTLVLPAQITTDGNGHGAHLTSIIANSDSPLGGFAGVAPAVTLFPVKAFDENGVGSYVDVIAALEAIIAYRDAYNIRVVNLSFSATPESYYWEDPLNQAVMAVWQAGIVVVAAAGNGGSDAMTVGVPGNVPYIITVGAITDNYTPAIESDDLLASFSAAGPTVEGFVKPDLVAPGGHIAGLVSPYASLAQTHPEYRLAGNYFMMSGTSQATAVASGVAALMISEEPALTPDDVKCRLMTSAHPALDAEGALTYSVFQQGAGIINAYDAVASTATGCANQGLDIDQDLSGAQHYGGPANLDEDGDFVLTDGSGNPMLDGFAWSGSYIDGDVFVWDDTYNWLDGFAWSGGIVFSDNYIWSTGDFWDDNYTWSNAFMSVDNWVPQE